jgi:hypothetical protein
VRRLAVRWPKLGRGLHRVKQRVELARARRALSADLEAKYQEEARVRAQEYTGYRHVPACATCDLRPVCDGFYRDYSDLFGTADTAPVKGL